MSMVATKKITIDLDELAKAVAEPTELTPEQAQKWSDTMSLMAWTAPGFRHLLYKLLNNNDGKYVAVPTRAVPVAATDGKNIMVNPDTFFAMSLKERVFVIGHEVIHNVYSDVEFLHRCKTSGKVPMSDGSTKPFNMKTMQHAMDYRINALLKESRIGAPPAGVLLDDKIAGPNDSVMDAYKKLYKKEDDDEGTDGFDYLLPPGSSTGQDPNNAANGRNPQQWGVEVKQAQMLESMRAQGHLPAGMDRMFKDILDPQVPWTEQIQSLLNRKLGSGGYDWNRADEEHIWRDVFLPARSGFSSGWIVVWGDTSGSITPTEMNKYLGELAGIIEDVKPERLTVLWCDAKIQQIDEVEDVIDLHKIKARGVKGGGGTAVEPCFKWIEDNGHYKKPEVFIGFTDGYVSFPSHAPDYHVIWASIADTKYPWGDVVRIK